MPLDPKTGALIAAGAKALAVADRKSIVANRALSRIKQECHIEFFATHSEASKAFIDAVSWFYPCSEALIERYADRWVWAKKGRLLWGGAAKEFDRGLSSNEALPWSEALIKRYADRWDWDSLSRNPALPWSEALIERYLDRWNWTALSDNGGLPWSEALIKRYADRWDWEDEFDGLSDNCALPWTEELIRRYTDWWSWDSLSRNPALPWSEALIERYLKRWEWGYLSGNDGLPWSQALIECYSDRWNWDEFGLSRNPALPWSEALIKRYADRWDWHTIVHSAFRRIMPQWTESTIRAVMDKNSKPAKPGLWRGILENEDSRLRHQQASRSLPTFVPVGSKTPTPKK